MHTDVIWSSFSSCGLCNQTKSSIASTKQPSRIHHTLPIAEKWM
jgi:hypothetical protein